MRVRAKATAPQEQPAQARIAAFSVGRHVFCLVLGLALAPLTALPASGKEGYITGGAERLGPPADETFRPPKQQQPGSRVIFRSEAPRDEDWILNAEMSRLPEAVRR